MMLSYYLTDGTYLFGWGECQAGMEKLHEREGLTLVIGHPPEGMPSPPGLPDSYSKLRARAYPSIGDQLDALWKGGDSLEEMRRSILAVKEQFPKP